MDGGAGGAVGVGRERGGVDLGVGAALREIAQRAAGDGDVTGSEVRAGFAEGEGDGGSLTGLEGRLVGGDDDGGAQRVDGVVVGGGGATASVARGVGDAGVVQRDEVGGVLDIGRRREGGGPGATAV